MQSAHDDENVARLFAVKVTAMQAILFVVGASIAGLAGALYAFQYNYLEPASFGAMMSSTYLWVAPVQRSDHSWVRPYSRLSPNFCEAVRNGDTYCSAFWSSP